MAVGIGHVCMVQLFFISKDTNECIKEFEVCDKHIDCQDKSNEDGKCGVGCETIVCTRGGCIPSLNGPICSKRIPFVKIYISFLLNNLLD